MKLMKATSVCVYVYVCMYVCMYVYVCMCVCVCVCITFFRVFLSAIEAIWLKFGKCPGAIVV